MNLDEVNLRDATRQDHQQTYGLGTTWDTAEWDDAAQRDAEDLERHWPACWVYELRAAARDLGRQLDAVGAEAIVYMERVGAEMDAQDARDDREAA